jgi:DNA-binding CsgD family transcriptional regulator
VLSLFESKAGNVWLGLDRGLDLVVRSAAVSFRTGNDRPPGVLYAAVRYAGITYLGTNQGLFRQDSSATGLTYEMVPGTSGQVWELRATPTGLLCGHNDGTFLVEGMTATLVSDRSGGWQTVEIDERPNRLLQATYTGLQLLEITDGGVESFVLSGFSAPIRYLGWAGRRKLLALHGSRGGFVLQLSEDCQRITSIDTLKDARLIKASIATFGDTLLVQSQEGLLRYADGQLLPVDTFRGIPLQPGQYCLPGHHIGEWFICSPDRIGVYQGREQTAELPLRLRFPFPVILPWENDDYLLLLEEGYARVQPRTEDAPEMAMTLRTAYQIAADWQPILDTITTLAIAYRNNDLRFTYALPAFDREVLYRSRLVGYAGDWTAWSSLGERDFTNLPEGDYRFEVEANWFGSTTEVQFQVLPPWYRSQLAYLAYALLLIGLFWWLYRLHLRRLGRQARHLEVVRQRELQRERTLARNRELQEDIKRKSKELANTTLTLAKKNELLLALKEELDKGRKRSDGQIDRRKVERLIERNLDNEEDWAIFESHFNEVHEAFLKRLREQYPNLTTGELKLAAYLRMDLSSKEIAPLLHISLRGVENKRYRLRKKLGMGNGDDLNRYLLVF